MSGMLKLRLAVPVPVRAQNVIPLVRARVVGHRGRQRVHVEAHLRRIVGEPIAVMCAALFVATTPENDVVVPMIAEGGDAGRRSGAERRRQQSKPS